MVKCAVFSPSPFLLNDGAAITDNVVRKRFRHRFCIFA